MPSEMKTKRRRPEWVYVHSNEMLTILVSTH